MKIIADSNSQPLQFKIVPRTYGHLGDSTMRTHGNSIKGKREYNRARHLSENGSNPKFDPESQMVYPKYEDHLNTLPMSAEIRALRRIQSSEGFNNNFNLYGTLNNNNKRASLDGMQLNGAHLAPRNAISQDDLAQGGGGFFSKSVQRHQSAREPMMSMVPEEASMHSSHTGTSRHKDGPEAEHHSEGSSRVRSRTAETLSQIRTVGSISTSDNVMNGNANAALAQSSINSSTLPRTHDRNQNEYGLFSRGNSGKKYESQTLPKNLAFHASKQNENYARSSYGTLLTQPREEGDGAVVSGGSYGDQNIVELLPDYPNEEEEPVKIPIYSHNNNVLPTGALKTIYRVGSLIGMNATSKKNELNEKVQGRGDWHNQPLTETLSRSKSEGVLFDQNSDFPDLQQNRTGILGGSVGALTQQYFGMKNWFSSSAVGANSAKMGDDKQSTLSRYWTMDRSLQRRLQKTNYQHIKRLCRDRGQLFEDTDFPPINRSIFKNKKPSLYPITWLRPHEICQRPKFIAEGATRFDVEQGEMGDPWLLAAVSSLTLTPRFLDRVVPPDQNFEHGYCGVFRFRFWHFGDWVEVLVDDRLPTYKGRLVYMHSTDPSEFWAALLEKAYAKLYGSYEALHQGFTTKALQDLTGGIVQSFSLSSQDRLLTYQVLNSAVPRSTLLIASINIDTRHDSKRQLRLRNGLITRHAYSVTGLARVRGQLGDTHLVRLRNPWGKGEWNGPWSERSWEWDSLSDRDKDLLSQRVRNEGEFWMAFDDFAKQFSHLDLVHIGPDDWMSESALHSKKPWRAVLARRRWRSGYNAGGSPQYIETTAMNPQFHIQIPRTNNVKCHVVVSVTQQYETNPGGGETGNTSGSSTSSSGKNKRRKKRKLHHIGFAVYEVPPHMTRLTPIYVAEHQPLDVTNHSVAREVVTFFTLPPGDYIVVPQTNVPNCDGKFLLRILTDEQSNIWEVNEDNMLFRNVLAEFEESFKYSESRVLLSKLVTKYPPEIDASTLQKILKSHWKNYLMEKPSLELCKSLVMLRDYNISGRVNLMEIPLLLHLLQFWRNAFVKYINGSGSGVKSSSFNLRLILWEAGITVSNKVLECLVLRFAKNKLLNSESYVTVMVRLHLAHERYHSIDTKMKGNPLSLEEMILMTIYS